MDISFCNLKYNKQRVMSQALQIYHTVYAIPFAWWAHQYANNVHIHYGYEGYSYNVRNKCDF